MSQLPEDLKYAASHEWVRVGDDGIATVGITDHAQNQLGDLVFVETPEVGSSCSAGETCGVVESVKAASDLYSPVSGEVTEINEALSDTPELINQSPYGDGWLFKVRLDTVSDELMDAAAYQQHIAD